MDINSISPSLRDSLLKRNLIFAKSVTQNYIQQYGTGLGRMVKFADDTLPVQDSEDLELTAVDYRNQLLGKNKYIPTADMAYRYSVEVNNYLQNDQVTGGYILDGKLNGIDDTSDLNGVVNLLSGDNFNSYGTQLASKLLQKITKANDTPLGVIGYERLVEEMKYRTKFAIEKETIGRLTLDPFDLINGEPLVKADMQITRSNSFFGLLGDKALDILGVQSSMMSMNNASVFNSDYPNLVNSGNNFYSTEDRNNDILENTGRGQANHLFKNLENSLKPNFSGKRNVYLPKLTKGNKSTDANYYLENSEFDGETIKILFEEYRDGVSDKYSTELNPDFSWIVEQTNTANRLQTSSGRDSFDEKPYIDSIDKMPRKVFNNKKTLLGKTQELFNNGIIKTLVGNKGMSTEYVNADFHNEEMVTTTSAGSISPMMSKGSNVVYAERIKNKSDNPNEVFCRSWINHHKYDTVYKNQKHRGLDGEGGYRTSAINHSVLDQNGYVKVAPYFSRTNPQAVDSKKYMFSIENLAWFDNIKNLPEVEIGSGDPLTGTKGRIMWFPPYDLQFSESTSTNLDTHQFIGRGEPIYTYNSTERTGNLSFKLIMDHPEWINSDGYKNKYGEDLDHFYNSIMAGCGNLPPYVRELLSPNEQDEIDASLAQQPIVKPVTEQTPPEAFKVYFPNDVASLGKIINFNPETFDDEIELYAEDVPTNDLLRTDYAYTMYEYFGNSSGEETEWIEIMHEGYTEGLHKSNAIPYPDRKNYGLNKKWKSTEFLLKLRQELKENCPYCKIYISGYASKDGNTEANSNLSRDRAKNVKEFLTKMVLFDDDINPDIRFGRGDAYVVGQGETGSSNVNEPVDHMNKKTPRSVTISFKPDDAVKAEAEKIYESKERERELKQIAANVTSRFRNEGRHFEYLEKSDSFTFNKIKDRIKYFQPAFHSITPEGFNSRLTFLNQCMRQGGTLKDSSRPDNMVFGAPPICILRIGDFYNTKIIIESMSINYEGLWDMNPEGVGVQPMIATIDLSFKFIGGSSMGGAINRLQNALSFNYYANTEIFDPRAYSIMQNGDEENNVRYVQGVENISEMLFNRSTIDSEDEGSVSTDASITVKQTPDS